MSSQARNAVGIEFPWTADISRLKNRETWGTRSFHFSLDSNFFEEHTPWESSLRRAVPIEGEEVPLPEATVIYSAK